MNTRRTTITLGAAAGGLLTAGFLQTAVAFADTADAAATMAPAATDAFGFVASGPEQATSVDGIPPLFQEVSGYQLFNVNDTTLGTTATPDTVGQFEALQSTSTFLGGSSNTEDVVSSDLATNAAGATLGITHDPTAGSVFDTFNFGNGFENVYSDILGGTAAAPTNTITDMLVTPFGDFNLSPVFGGFDASLNPADFTFGPFLTAPDLMADLTGTAATSLADTIGADLGVPAADITPFLADLAALF